VNETLNGFINYGLDDSLENHYIFIGKLITIISIKSEKISC